MIQVIKSVFIHLRFFLAAGLVIVIFLFSFAFSFLFPVAKAMLLLFGGLVIVDAVFLYSRSVKFKVGRSISKIMSLGSENPVVITIENLSTRKFSTAVIDELPFQFQERNNVHLLKIKPLETVKVEKYLRPFVRGEYHFGKVHLFITTRISLLQRKVSFDLERMVMVYPSVIDLKKYELRAGSRLSNYFGFKKTRKIGQSYEFEQISEYKHGDNYQHMNWKATSKMNRLMVNRYTDEKSQPIYCVIDKSRYMKMPFKGLTLLDYSINASLIIANTSLKRSDKAGLLTFSDQVETHVKADNKRTQLDKILKALYHEDETKIEANYELMYAYLRQTIPGRSLFFLFSNFDTVYALERVLPVLRKINLSHLLVVIVFENTELEEFHRLPAESMLDIYNQTVARKILYEKKQVLSLLSQHAIHVIYTKPEDLSLNTLNKYLELKSRGMI